MSNNPTPAEAQPSSAPASTSDAAMQPVQQAELAVRATERTYEQWPHAIIRLPLLTQQFRHLSGILNCFPKTDISVNEIFERINSVIGRGHIRGAGPSTTASSDLSTLQAQVRRLQDQVDNVQREQSDLWRELAISGRRDAPREQRVERRRDTGNEYAATGWASNRDELYHDYDSRHDEVARRGGGY